MYDKNYPISKVRTEPGRSLHVSNTNCAYPRNSKNFSEGISSWIKAIVRSLMNCTLVINSQLTFETTHYHYNFFFNLRRERCGRVQEMLHKKQQRQN